MGSFQKIGDRIELVDGSWVTVNRFEPLDTNRANIGFVYIGRNKRRNETRIATRVPESAGIGNVWKFQYDGNLIYFEMV